jgi:hypothetical protein
MSSSSEQLKTRLSSIAAKSKNIEYTETKIPPPTQDFHATFKSAFGASKIVTDNYNVNVLPDFRPILCYILYHVAQAAPFLEMTTHDKISHATLTAYCFALIYSFWLASDLHIRTPSGFHSAPYDLEQHRRSFLDFMLRMPVPEFLVPLFSQFQPSVDETRSSIWFGPSASGFKYTTHFGRFFPLSMFFAVHDTIAINESSARRLAILSQLLRVPLYRITAFPGRTDPFTASTGHFIGTGISVNSLPHFYYSRLNQSFTSLFNPVLFRDYQRRKNLAPISLRPITYANETMNFYDLVFSASATNLSELRNVFTAIASAFQGKIKCPGDLASMFKDTASSAIFAHSYSQFALPTFFHSDIASLTSDTDLPSLTEIDAPTFATTINFLQAPRRTGFTANWPQPTGTCQTDANHRVVTTFTSVLNRLNPDPQTPAYPANSDFIIFDDQKHVYPTVLVLNPFDPTTIDAYRPPLFGMIIESMDIDGTVIALPNAQNALGTENIWFADSAIPERYTYHATRFGSGNNTPALARNRVVHRTRSRMPAASILVDRTKVFLPRFIRANNPPTTSVQAFTGLTDLPRVNWAHMVQSFLGFRTSDRITHDDASDSIPGMSQDRLLVWSPYTYTGYEGSDDHIADPDNSKVYHLTNLRSLFGSRIPLVEGIHPLDCMPTS